jgi:hypothetical protein
MKNELETLLKAFDAFDQAGEGPEAERLKVIYDARLQDAAETSGLNKELLDQAVRKFHPRWVRANLPPGFPRKLGLE